MWFGYLADALVAAHFALVVFISIGQIVIIVGAIRGWAWIRNFWFRLAHVIAMTSVGLQAVLGVHCPLTVWENDLRGLAGQSVSEATFIGRFLNEVLFVEFSTQALNAIHISFALVVLVTFVLVPPRWPWTPRTLAN